MGGGVLGVVVTRKEIFELWNNRGRNTSTAD